MNVKTLSSGIIPVKLVENEWHFLILRCFKYWDFPKGQVEMNEDPWQTALRELQEETGMTSITTPWGQEFIETPVYAKGKVARYYLAEVGVHSKVTLLPNRENGLIEHHEFRWLPYLETKALLVPRVQAVLDWAYLKIQS